MIINTNNRKVFYFNDTLYLCNTTEYTTKYRKYWGLTINHTQTKERGINHEEKEKFKRCT